MSLAGCDTAGAAGAGGAAGIAARLGLPLCSAAALIEPDPAAGSVRVRRLSAKGYDVVEAPMPAVLSCTQALGEPRYPSLKGIMSARSREIAVRSLADFPEGLVPAVGGWATTVLSAVPPATRAVGRTVTAGPADAAREIADFLADRRLI